MKHTFYRYQVRVHDVCSKFASYVLRACFMYASSCKRGITYLRAFGQGGVR